MNSIENIDRKGAYYIFGTPWELSVLQNSQTAIKLSL